MRRSDFLAGLSIVGAAIPQAAAIDPNVAVAGIRIPDTALAKEATAIALSVEPVEIFNHSLRTFYFAELVARARKLDHDVEAVFVASILHDTGLTQRYMSPKQRFEVDGANLSRDVLGAHGVTGSRADLVWDAIALHDSGGIARWKQTEVALVNAGVSTDFGANLDALARSDVSAIVRAASRENFIPVFLEAVATVVKAKPFATGSCFVTDVGYRMVPGFHLDNFCDEVKADPFAGYV